MSYIPSLSTLLCVCVSVYTPYIVYNLLFSAASYSEMAELIPHDHDVVVVVVGIMVLVTVI